MENNGESNVKGKIGAIQSVIFSKDSPTFVHRARDAGWALSAELEQAELTGLVLELSNGWRLSLTNPKKQAILNKGANPYAKTAISRSRKQENGN